MPYKRYRPPRAYGKRIPSTPEVSGTQPPSLSASERWDATVAKIAGPSFFDESQTTLANAKGDTVSQAKTRHPLGPKILGQHFVAHVTELR